MKDLKVAFDAADTNHDERLSQKELYIKLKMEGQNPSWYTMPFQNQMQMK